MNSIDKDFCTEKLDAVINSVNRLLAADYPRKDSERAGGSSPSPPTNKITLNTNTSVSARGAGLMVMIAGEAWGKQAD
jgi:hypothetical protein